MTDRRLFRRLFLKQAAVLAASLTAPAMAHASLFSTLFPGHTEQSAPPKSLKLYNTHTAETFSGEFWADGKFLPDAVGDINHLLRDHRSNEVMAMDSKLLLLLQSMSAQVGAGAALHVISGYRSPQTNQMLADRSNGVAKHSLHLEGKAIDIRVPGRELSLVRKVAISLGGGGVGFYPDSQFVHLDTGRVRNW